jgi:hypothetical protein
MNVTVFGATGSVGRQVVDQGFHRAAPAISN